MNTEKTEIKINLPENQNFLMPVNEITACQIVNRFSEQQIREFAKSPKQNLFAMFDVDAPDDFTINVVKNTDTQVHLALPFYESFDGIQIDELSDEQIADTVGGEIICIAVGGLIGAKIAAIIGVKAATTVAVIGGVAGVTGTVVPASINTVLAGAAIGGAVGAGVAAAAGATVAAGVAGAQVASGDK